MQFSSNLAPELARLDHNIPDVYNRAKGDDVYKERSQDNLYGIGQLRLLISMIKLSEYEKGLHPLLNPKSNQQSRDELLSGGNSGQMILISTLHFERLI